MLRGCTRFVAPGRPLTVAAPNKATIYMGSAGRSGRCTQEKLGGTQKKLGGTNRGGQLQTNEKQWMAPLALLARISDDDDGWHQRKRWVAPIGCFGLRLAENASFMRCRPQRFDWSVDDRLHTFGHMRPDGRWAKTRKPRRVRRSSCLATGLSTVGCDEYQSRSPKLCYRK